jgi:hypothetical protein
MKARVHFYRLSFRPEADYGSIRIYLEDGSFYDFTRLTPQRFNSLFNILSKEPVYWDGTWLFTDEELIQQ